VKEAVIDASVVLKWFLADETYGQRAISLLSQYVSKELEIFAPSLLEYEVVNGLIIAQKRGRIKEERILTAIEGFVSLEIKLIHLSHLYPKVLHYCRIYNRSAYDASYLAVADELNIDLITADEGVYHMVKKDLRWVKWLGDI
jgi:predicted nucleic acid-binding protein